MYPKSRVSPLNQNGQQSGLNLQTYGSQQNFNMRKVSPSPPVNRVNSQGLSPTDISVNNLGGTSGEKTQNYPMQPLTTMGNTNSGMTNPMGVENISNPTNRSQSSSLTRQAYNPPVSSYNANNNNSDYYKGSS